ncbi:MAG: protein kinase domain-containing protein, partial [Stackebrandtia sp.]
GRYRLTGRIAAGGMGTVWRAFDTRLERDVAIKVLHPSLSNDASFRRRFLTEARVIGSLDHPGIVGVHDFGEDATDADGEVVYLVMQFIDGTALTTVLAQRERLGPDETLTMLATCADALAVAHDSGVVHRDIKPGNILIDDDGNAKIVDFGIARTAGHEGITTTGVVMGTLPYIAPEQLQGAEAGPSGDIYSLGVVGYQCLAGHRPFRSEVPAVVITSALMASVPPLPSEVPADVAAIIMRALEKDPDLRWTSAAEFAEACRTRPPVTAAPAGDKPPDTGDKPDEPAVAPTRRLRRPSLIATVAAVAAVLLVSAAFIWQPWAGGGVKVADDPASTGAPSDPIDSPSATETDSSAESPSRDAPDPETSPAGTSSESSSSPESLRVPDMVGMRVFAAEKALKDEGFTNYKVGGSTECVVSQHPVPDHMAYADTFIEVKSNPQPEDEPCRKPL